MFSDIQFQGSKDGVRIFSICDTDHEFPLEVRIPEDDKRLGIHARAIIKHYKVKEKIIESLVIFFSTFYDRKQTINWVADALGEDFLPYKEAVTELVTAIPKLAPEIRVSPPAPIQKKRGRK